jgi:hypothetical protein
MDAPIPLQPFPTPPSGPQPLPTHPGFGYPTEPRRSILTFPEE